MEFGKDRDSIFQNLRMFADDLWNLCGRGFSPGAAGGRVFAFFIPVAAGDRVFPRTPHADVCFHFSFRPPQAAVFFSPRRRRRTRLLAVAESGR